MSAIAERVSSTRSRLQAAEQRFGRPAGSVTLLAVSKRQPASALRAAHAAGLRRFGENYLSEALGKQAQLRDLDLEWHYIGPIQSNKTKDIALNFDWVHTLDRLKVARRLSEQRPPGRAPLQVCLQVNISGEASKSGCSPRDTLALAHAIAALPRLRLRGLMCIPAPDSDFSRQRAAFARLAALQAHCRETGLALDTLSMGMSGDLEAAVAEGCTLVRIGTALFGPREQGEHA
ncbi:YggS family pyridoxal phosphate-dependent enzyme [Alkalilimnicola sp. S0819]|uniref:YggS family pyridoxal phosphate-dependent enzyme n=1 Tax=Alkalilimnicola sp. S0819 TaxID=2613922 RepID=UPI00126284D0|nr:YggS family pyridoxal phosphate-dependent enzyme [Alkalilimnicola sp. S0819]KAB7624456.1 YggS family pyridoxal phosphate-dependent enzyme [Alkalilimnicola sp. S0819]MPQ16290.1 YggS family pyridoxal phosphate-dependent enzyme [Alkalilimnicola sp. S0819]